MYQLNIFNITLINILHINLMKYDFILMIPKNLQVNRTIILSAGHPVNYVRQILHGEKVIF